ncbi:MAG: T9SS type A sorting domain-containing protein [Saprospiraceae bacterium]|nr:T9SS type A sorting domain-containing protein [Saprospiraceae bacterium]
MAKYLLCILMMVSIVLSGQEQVTNILNPGVVKAHIIWQKIGFAHINGEVFMLQEHEGLTIFKLSDGQFFEVGKIENLEHQQIQFIGGGRLSSQFDIRDQKYYRYFTGGYQVINIIKAEIIESHNLTSKNIPRIVPVSTYQHGYYFRDVFDFTIPVLCHYSAISGRVDTLSFSENRADFRYFDHLLFSIDGQKKLFVRDPVTLKDTLLLDSAERLYFVSFSEKDSTMVYRDAKGAIFKIDRQLSILTHLCPAAEVKDAKSVFVNGDFLICIYDFATVIGKHKDEVKIYQLGSCNLEMSFITEYLKHYVDEFHYLKTPDISEDFLVIGFTGSNPADDLSDCMYYVVDRKSKRYSFVSSVTWMMDGSARSFENKLIFSAYDNYHWELFSYLVSYDINTGNIKKSDPNINPKTESISMGFGENGKMYFAANTAKHDPAIWHFDQNETFAKLRPLDLKENLGIYYINYIIQGEDSLYFFNNNGLYSVSESLSPRIPFPPFDKTYENSVNINYYQYEDYIVFFDKFTNTTFYQIFNTKTGALDSVKDERIGKIFNPVGMDKYILSRSPANELFLFDIVKKDFIKVNNLPAVSGFKIFSGKSKAVILYNAPEGSTERKSYWLHYDTQKTEPINLDLNGDVHVLSGFDGSFYFIENNFTAKKTKVRLLQKDGNISVVYDGKGKWNLKNSVSISLESPVALFLIQTTPDSCVVLTNDFTNTTSLFFPYYNFYASSSPFRQRSGNKFVLRTGKSYQNQYWYYDSFKEPIPLVLCNSLQVFSNMSDSLVTLVWKGDYQHTLSLSYDIINQVVSADSIAPDCLTSGFFDGVAIDDQSFLIPFDCNYEREPWIYNVKNQALSLLSDIYPGIFQSDPRNFLLFKNYVYFTATLPQNNRQWFRYAIHPEIPEEPFEPKKFLAVFPSPASHEIYLKENLKDLSVYSIDGKQVLYMESYTQKDKIDVYDWMSGMYILVGKNQDDKIRTGKMIKVRGK